MSVSGEKKCFDKWIFGKPLAMATQSGISPESQRGISTPWIVSLAIGAIVAAVMALTKAHHHSAGAALFAALLFMFVIALVVRGVIWLIQKTA